MGSHISAKRAPRDVAAKQVLDSLRRLLRMLRSSSRESEQRVGLNAAQLFVLAQLADGSGLSIGDLARRTLTHQSSVSVVVQRLVDAGLVQRVPVSDDRRRVRVTLTPAGQRRLGDAPDIAQDHLLRAVAAMGARERVALVQGLASLVGHLGLAHEAPAMLFPVDEPVGTELSPRVRAPAPPRAARPAAPPRARARSRR